MNGVEILSATAITDWYVWTFIVADVVALVVVVVVAFSTRNVMRSIVAGFVAFMLCAIVFGDFGVGSYETGEYEYKVTIDDSVSMNEFLDKYEILDQEGKIYTVKERE